MLQLGLRRIFARCSITPFPSRGSVSKRLAHFERVLDGNRRILRKNMQSTLVVTSWDKISKKPQKTRLKKNRGKNLHKTQETSKEEEPLKLKQKLNART